MALLRVDPGLVIWLWITFGIILLVLRLTVWKQITSGLDKRSQRIATDLESARAAGAKAGEVLAEYAEKIREGKPASSRRRATRPPVSAKASSCSRRRRRAR